MGREIEIKLALADPQLLRARLAALGASFVERRAETNRLFDAADRRLYRAGCGLRLREMRSLEGVSYAPRAVMTYKGPAGEGVVREREEIETEVADPAGMRLILERLGFHEVIRYEKRRETWTFREHEIALDELPVVGWFVEVEGPAQDGARGGSVRREGPAASPAIEELVVQLGLSASAATAETYVAMAARLGRSASFGPTVLEF